MKQKRHAHTQIIVLDDAILRFPQVNKISLETPITTVEQLVELLTKTDYLKKNRALELYLPSLFFVVTHFELENIPQKELAQALHYQQEELLPGFEEPLRVIASADSKGQLAIWFRQEWLDSLYTALHAKGIRLRFIAPRILLAANNCEEPCLIEDHEQTQITLLEMHQGDLLNWQSFSRQDLKENEIAANYQDYLKRIETNQFSIHRFSGIQEWIDKDYPNAVPKNYRFHPSETQQRLLRRRANLIKFAVVFSLMILSAAVSYPLAKLYYHQFKLEKQVAEQKTLGNNALQFQSSIIEQERYWEALEQYPDPRLLGLLKEIDQHLPKHSWLKSFQLREGIILIDGYSPNPASVIESLSKLTDFTQVGFSRASRQERDKPDKDFFGIRLTLKQQPTAYYERFFSRH